LMEWDGIAVTRGGKSLIIGPMRVRGTIDIGNKVGLSFSCGFDRIPGCIPAAAGMKRPFDSLPVPGMPYTRFVPTRAAALPRSSAGAHILFFVVSGRKT